jgi:hypothetical protein
MQEFARKRLVLRALGVAGAGLFAFFFVLTWHTPRWVETFAARYIEGRVVDQVDQRIDALGPPQGQDALSRYAAKLYAGNEEQIARYKNLLKQDVRNRLSECIAQMLALSDSQRAHLDTWIEAGAQFNVGSLQLDNTRLVALIQSGYLRVVANLKGEIRIFTASNAFVFLLLLLVSFLRPQAVRELFVPGVLLATSTLLCAYLYVFAQDWLLTMIHGSYLGYAYDAWLLAAFLVLCDVWLNQARITTRLIGVVGDAVGGLVSTIS